MLKSAIRDNNPIMFVESQLLYGIKGDVPESAFVAKLRQAIAIAEHLRVVADKERSADRFAVPSAANIGDGEC